ncbi:Oxoglutarate and iron-dependent oxygenase degradation C-term-domain-containing protein [Kockovaella imperatae]|uniref:Oxoglutarate and iron-dependent oxygenase degradation C-term-domain-containing protein n=1 Tax=Kockovaella imperatae TaxID=4999 RepID=A0A1Y1UC29_9TREE|nr:Oxoglutarate and iron-dependent oxygenase degradation C-term-domain-containing protein [Kockovaella imperatae]ORX35046.1 Oxoglutarate and iron-dependent oxygenase degradation C-term-domain-containing protein [Kockovaella imperatae]
MTAEVEGRATKKRRVDIGSKVINLPLKDDLKQERVKYEQAEPYKHAVLHGLISDELLEAVVEESRTYGNRGEEDSLQGWGWEQKETDIYKIQQTPDLSSLDPEHLPQETLDRLPELTRLKDALYSQDFRNFVREVTGCGPLSGKKTDGSVGLYTKGSHLLLHDDSISTRLVSYILYLPNSPSSAPSSSACTLSSSGNFTKGWDASWGGSLELYPVEESKEVGPPESTRSKKIPATWGQLVLFEVQPGRSYHAVEEVIVGEDRQRLGVSGWFHRPIEGEEGYEPMDQGKLKDDLSSLAQITAAPSKPFVPFTETPPPGLKPSHISFLKDYLSPSYLTTQTLEKLSGQFVEASEIALHNFLKPELAATLKQETQEADRRDYSDPSRITDQRAGEDSQWEISGPPSKHRYLSLSTSAESSSTPTMSKLLTQLIPSEAFRAWLSVVSSLLPVGHRTEARRFRKGLDYTLANGEDKTGEARLDVWLGATWWADVPVGSDQEDDLADHGGWDCYLASPEEGEDPAVYQSKMARQSNGHAPESESAEPGPSRSDGFHPASEDAIEDSSNTIELEIDPAQSDQLSEGDFDSDSEDEFDPDAPLLVQPVSFNKLLIVLRDPGVMRFVKYLGNAAEGSRWDVGGEFEVGAMEEADEEEAAAVGVMSG